MIGIAATLVAIFFILVVSYVSYECGYSAAADRYEPILEEKQDTIEALTAPQIKVLD